MPQAQRHPPRMRGIQYFRASAASWTRCHLCGPFSLEGRSGILGGFNRSSQHALYGSRGGPRRELPQVFSSRVSFEVWS